MNQLIITLLFLISYGYTKGHEDGFLGVVKFEYAGDVDKPIRSIFITTKKYDNDIDPNQVDILYVSEKTYKAIESFVKLREEHATDSTKSRDENLMVLRAGIETQNINKEYSLLSRADGVLYLIQLKKQLLTSQNLNKQDIDLVIDHVNIFITRIDW